MHRKAKRDPKRQAPDKSVHALRHVDKLGKLVRKTTTFVTPLMRDTLTPGKETW